MGKNNVNEKDDYFIFRNPLVISISEDEGLNWIHTRILEVANATNHVEFSYPSLFQESSGRIHVSYTYNRETIKHKIIPNEAWIHVRCILGNPIVGVSDQVRHKPSCTTTEDG